MYLWLSIFMFLLIYNFFSIYFLRDSNVDSVGSETYCRIRIWDMDPEKDQKPTEKYYPDQDSDP
jgi:hypothetical protein